MARDLAYLAKLIPHLPDGNEDQLREATEVSKLLTLLQSDIARANGKAKASVVVSCRHHTLSQSKLPLSVQKTFLELPLTPGMTFDPGVDSLLQQTAKLRKDRAALQEFMARPTEALEA
ncbi:hypothetical protein SKAU_G00249850 [Synaphobranchus kaupii]|uniref:Uncharacterized protein n=1 Tax=Synaphobranchus kaupii TaxID=118154 RepID=A0A9Q1F2V3_SYNKA|nr:hypothetical protein SKAU_G00249850 [Synaphobranchus kaupii]